jgi:hypothetical protein
MTTRITADNISDGAVTSDRIAANALTLDKIAVGTFGPRITSIVLPGSVVAVLPNGSENFTINGSNFQPGVQVYIGTAAAAVVTYISSTQLVVTVPVMSPGTYPLYVTNTDGGTAIRLLAITVSTAPVWATESTLPLQTASIYIQLSAASDSSVVYSLASDSSLPTGLTLNSFGVLSGNVTIASILTTYNFTVIATDSESQTNSRTFSVSISTSDSNFSSVVLLLKTTGATIFNTNFADSSTANSGVGFPVIRNGTPSRTTSTPYYPLEGYWSINDNATASTNAAFTFSGQFSVEYWVYWTTKPVAISYIAGSALPGGIFVAYGYNGDNIEINRYGSGAICAFGFDSVFQLNRWHHFAYTRNASSVHTMWVDGIARTSSGAIGSTWSNNGFFWGLGSATGFTSNVRVINGSCPYTDTFTPPTAPFTRTDSPNTVFLSSQSNRIVDNSVNNISISTSARVQTRSPFTDPVTYSTATYAGSALFNGSTDYLSVANNAAFQILGNFTIEMWIFPTVLSGTRGLFGHRPSENYGPIVLEFAGAALNFYVSTSGTSWAVGLTSPALTANVWTHIALVRNGTTVSYYINGVAGGATGTATGALMTPVSPLYLGVSSGVPQGAGYFSGNISNFRFVNGAAIYPAAFTAPTLPVPNTPNTTLLLNFSESTYVTVTDGANNTTFLDNSPNFFPITRNGSTTQGSRTPYWPDGQWSNYFNGSTDYLTAPSNAAFAFGTGDFTIECWVNTPIVNANNDVLIELRSSGATSTGFVFNMNPTGVGYQLNFYTDGGFNLGSTVLNYNVWNHVAVTRSGTTVRLFSNGVVSATFIKANNFSDMPVPRIGSSPLYSPSSVNGYISNFRVVKGTAVYTAAFTPPTTPLTAIANTVLLTCQSNRFRDNSTNNFAITVNGTPQVQTFRPFASTVTYSPAVHGASGYFNGTTDYLSLASNAEFNIFGGDMTIDGWLYPTALTGRSEHFLAFIVNDANRVSLYFSGTSFIFWTSTTGGGNGPKITSASFPRNTWTHVALVKSGATFTLYVNGISAGTSSTTVYPTSAMSLNVGTYNGVTSTDAFTGYMSNVRIVKGTAIYTAAFAPPTAPMTNTGITSLLLNFDNAGIYDATVQNAVTTVSDARVNIARSQWPPSSMFFDGTGDWLTMPNNPAFAFGTGDFTIECWVYFTSVSGAPTITDSRSSTSSTAGFNLGLSSARVQLYTTSQLLIGATTLVINQWYYIAVTRVGTALKIFVNGSQDATTSNSTNWSDQTLVIGATPNLVNLMTGYIQDLRITRGLARTVTTVPTIPFQTLGTVPVTVSDPPVIGTATVLSRTSVSVTFIAPSYNGNSAITSYTAVSTPSSISGTVNQSGSGSITVTGLAPFTTYTFKVYATNSIGGSVLSGASNSVTTGDIITSVEYLVVAGGGSGGSYFGGGGGAGGLLTTTGYITAAATNYTVTVGAGGSGAPAGSRGNQGSNSVFGRGTVTNSAATSGSITSIGGGGGAITGNGTTQPATSGGSGGGGGADVVNQTGGAGTAGQGNSGGSSGNASGNFSAAGGGGASAVGVGAPLSSSPGGNGGAGNTYTTVTSITGLAASYAGGGGGSTGGATAGTGGTGGGGNGSRWSTGDGSLIALGTAGSPNTGGGAGGHPSLNGGSGVVIIAYPDTFTNLASVSATLTSQSWNGSAWVNNAAGSTTPNTTIRPGYKVYRFSAGTGDIQW